MTKTTTDPTSAHGTPALSIKEMIALGDLKVRSSSFGETTFTVVPATEAGERWFDENIGRASVSVEVLKSSLI